MGISPCSALGRAQGALSTHRCPTACTDCLPDTPEGRDMECGTNKASKKSQEN